MKRHDPFLSPRLSPRTVDNFLIRRRIRDALQESAPLLGHRVLDVGCGDAPYRALVTSAGGIGEYVGVDLANSGYAPPDVVWDGAILPFPDGRFDGALATEFLEHVPDPEAILAEIARVLRPGGAIFLTVPFVWPLHCSPHDYHRYTPETLERHLSHAGFDGIELRPAGGWDASLAQVIGLWARRRPQRRLTRIVASFLAMPLIFALDRMDEPGELRDNLLFPGIFGFARKK